MWSGNMRLALVSVPVKLFAATRSGARISFHQVHEPSGKRVRYEKVVPGIGPVDTDEIVKGFEVDDGSYVLIDPAEIDELKLEARKTLDLVQFVEHGEIDPIWFDRPYYVVPDGDLAEEAYRVMRDALRTSSRVGLGQFVMRGREYIAAVKPCGDGLLLETLRFADEVRAAAPFFASVEDDKPDAELLDLAGELIDRKSAPFDPKRFEDQYTKALRELIDAKAKRRKPVEIDEEDLPSGGAQVIDLVEALKRSVKSAERPAGKASSGGRKRKAG
ncbi:Ku protein [Thalassobaculum sp.]|uniref:non-homologous end joining protein Ku n=1 Tax=Thalassobaculum sp. TaxID=2022740 RepID=UPI0032ED6776